MFEDGYSGASARGLGAMMAGGAKTKRTRRENDFYPTAWEATAALALHQKAALVAHVVWEPACGDGSMAIELARQGVQIGDASDLIDRGYGRTGVDFLTAPMADGITGIITNPPFGELAPAFIKRALFHHDVPYLALLLKSHFWHARNRYGIWQRRRPTTILPLTWRLDFTGEASPVMEMCWYVWDRATTKVDVDLLLKPKRVEAAMSDLMERVTL